MKRKHQVILISLINVFFLMSFAWPVMSKDIEPEDIFIHVFDGQGLTDDEATENMILIEKVLDFLEDDSGANLEASIGEIAAYLEKTKAISSKAPGALRKLLRIIGAIRIAMATQEENKCLAHFF